MATLDATAALARLKRMIQATAAPLLDADEIADLFLMVPQITDAASVAPGGVGYVPTYSPYAAAFREAAATGWEWKAGKVAAEYKVATGGGTSYERQQQFDMCMEQAAIYGGGAKRSSGIALGSVRLVTPSTRGCD